MYECCKTCNYCCSVRKHPTYQEILTHICVFFLVQEGADYIPSVVVGYVEGAMGGVVAEGICTETHLF